VAYNEWDRKIDHWLIKSTRHSLPSLRRPSTTVCRPGKQANSAFRQSLVQEVEHNVSAIQETLIMWLITHAQMYFIISMQIFVLPCHRFKPKKIDNIRSMIRWRIHSTGMDPAMAQPHNNQGSFDEDFLDYIPEELIEQPNNSCNPLSSFVAATEASMLYSAVLPMGGSAIASSSQPVPCSNSNSIDITSISNMTGIENMGSVDGSTIVEGAMSLRG